MDSATTTTLMPSGDGAWKTKKCVPVRIRMDVKSAGESRRPEPRPQ